MWRGWFIRANNALVRRRRVRVRPDQVLVLLPRCLHRDGCPQNVLRDVGACARCGKCSLADLVRVREDYGMVCCVVGGGRQAVEQARNPSIKAVVAVACERELVAGIRAAFPKPVFALLNQTPEGPCHNALVDVGAVIAAVEGFTRGAATQAAAVGVAMAMALGMAATAPGQTAIKPVGTPGVPRQIRPATTILQPASGPTRVTTPMPPDASGYGGTTRSPSDMLGTRPTTGSEAPAMAPVDPVLMQFLAVLDQRAQLVRMADGEARKAELRAKVLEWAATALAGKRMTIAGRITDVRVLGDGFAEIHFAEPNLGAYGLAPSHAIRLDFAGDIKLGLPRAEAMRITTGHTFEVTGQPEFTAAGAKGAGQESSIKDVLLTVTVVGDPVPLGVLRLKDARTRVAGPSRNVHL